MIENNNTYNIDENKKEKATKVAFSGKVLPATSEDFEKLFEGVTTEDGKKLQFEDKLKMVIKLAKEKMLEDELQLEKESKEEVTLDIEEEKKSMELVANIISRTINNLELKAKAQFTDFKTSLATDVILNAKNTNANTIKLLEDFKNEYSLIAKEKEELSESLNVKDEEISKLKEQIKVLEADLIESNNKTKELEEIYNKVVIEADEYKETVETITDKFTSQLEKNDKLRDTKEKLEQELSQKTNTPLAVC